MTTVRDFLMTLPLPAPPPEDATHILCWETYIRPDNEQRGEWEIIALEAEEASQEAGGPTLNRPADIGDAELAEWVSCHAGGPVVLSPRYTATHEGEAVPFCYVTPAGGDR